MSGQANNIKFSRFLSYSTPCFLYALFSIAVTFSNKQILGEKQYNWGCPVLLLLFQNITSVALIKILSYFRYIEVQPIKVQTLIHWIPLNLMFVMMTMTSNYSLQYLSVAMVIIFKHLQTIAIALGDNYLFEEPLGFGSYMSIIIMMSGGIVAGFNDLEYNPVGYIWSIFNCSAGAAYSLYTKYAMKSTKLDRYSSVYYNNFCSLPILIFIVLFTNELPRAFLFEPYTGGLVSVLMFNAFCGFAISVASFWCISATSPTTLSIVGASNKLPLSILSVWWFKTSYNFVGGVSGFTALMGGILYALTKPSKDKSSQQKGVGGGGGGGGVGGSGGGDIESGLNKQSL
eukprot:TRINITY_DN11327_c0_g1_i1.p1 TRINITY_DN11327_c0_g1~~TRINITY_DN11327_c0_g1_i1.p1  ORF type:complete len:344 (+),score=69.03 TRINITY_DN11327_c0_g1_i1:47-1078(+)